MPCSPEFGICAGGMDSLNPVRAAILSRSGFGTVSVELFPEVSAGRDVAAISREAASYFALLREHRCEPVVVLERLPDAVARRLLGEAGAQDAGRTGWLRTLSRDRGLWARELAAAAGPVASRTVHWQMGRHKDPRLSPEQLTRAARNLRELLTPMTYSRKIGVVFDGSESREMVAAARVCDFVVLDCPRGADRRRLAHLISQLKTVVEEVWVELSITGSQREASLTPEELVEFSVRARASGADRVIFASLDGGMLDDAGKPNQLLSAAAGMTRQRHSRP
jgi:hypothetical protein